MPLAQGLLEVHSTTGDTCSSLSCRHVRFALDVRPADLNFEIPSGETIPNGYTLLDLVFVAATSNQRRDNFAETYKILRVTLEYTPRVVPLGLIGQDLL